MNLQWRIQYHSSCNSWPLYDTTVLTGNGVAASLPVGKPHQILAPVCIMTKTFGCLSKWMNTLWVYKTNLERKLHSTWKCGKVIWPGWGEEEVKGREPRLYAVRSFSEGRWIGDESSQQLLPSIHSNCSFSPSLEFSCQSMRKLWVGKLGRGEL